MSALSAGVLAFVPLPPAAWDGSQDWQGLALHW